MRAAAIIVAAGEGSRAGSAIPKQFLPLAGKPAVAWSAEALLGGGMQAVVVAAPPNRLDACRSALGALPAKVVAGGASRTASVRAALASLDHAEIILVHDAARPGLRPALVRELAARIEAGAVAAAPAIPVSDALRRQDGGEVERAGLMQVQTPQAFRGDVLRAAYAAAPPDASFSDDLAAVAAMGHAPLLVPGDPCLMKITFPGDAAMVERLLDAVCIPCVGHGIDAHRFGPGDHVTLCGVRIAHDRGLIGHSDADAGWHALVDAILGAVGEGDIGAHFPPSDPQWKGADSERFLTHARQLVAAAGAQLAHVDITLMCERPKIGPHRQAMRERTAAALVLPVERVSVKATTTEGLGFLGRGEGLAAQATATLLRRL